MTLTGYPFTLQPGERHPLLAPEEHEGLCCLLERARHYGGAGDIVFLCLSGCALLLRFAPEQDGAWTARGYAFQKGQEPWVWVYLPAMLGTLLAPPDGKLRFRAEQADAADEWLQRHDAALWDGAQRFARDTARQMHAHPVGFTRLDPSVYAEDSIRWYALTPARAAQDNTVILPPAAPEQEDGLRIVPPRLTRTWRAVRGEEKYKLGPVDERSDWYDFAARVRRAFPDA